MARDLAPRAAEDAQFHGGLLACFFYNVMLNVEGGRLTMSRERVSAVQERISIRHQLVWAVLIVTITVVVGAALWSRHGGRFRGGPDLRVLLRGAK
ncbi:MAG: hypothetical protein A3C54_00730 [Deltaproteobacteria bacterium RIFCSPHIGHO2_02_FULL_60_17]|nr:MAG: hypothetical protein A3C54_00730 [Deltaproteobacteria bacterium RIFCSPHIGHO2_02_FULL_60_17]